MSGLIRALQAIRPAFKIVAALLLLVTLPGLSLDLHNGAGEHRALAEASVFIDASHGGQPAHLESSRLLEGADCAVCLLQLKSFENGSPTDLPGSTVESADATQWLGPAHARSRADGLLPSRAPPLG